MKFNDSVKQRAMRRKAFKLKVSSKFFAKFTCAYLYLSTYTPIFMHANRFCRNKNKMETDCH